MHRKQSNKFSLALIKKSTWDGSHCAERSPGIWNRLHYQQILLGQKTKTLKWQQTGRFWPSLQQIMQQEHFVLSWAWLRCKTSEGQHGWWLWVEDGLGDLSVLFPALFSMNMDRQIHIWVGLLQSAWSKHRGTWVCLCNTATFLEPRKTKAEKDYGYQQNNNLLGKHQEKRRII